MKYNLDVIIKNISAYRKVTDDVCKQMVEFIKSSKQKQKDPFEDAYKELVEDDVQEFNPLINSQQKTITKDKWTGKRKAKDSIEKFVVPRSTPYSQPEIQSVFSNGTSLRIHSQCTSRMKQ